MLIDKYAKNVIMSNMNEIELVDRRQVILEAAFKIFVTYGFKRTTMKDIAAAAGLSRPVLYLSYKNKTEIFRAKFIDMIVDIEQAMRQAFESQKNFEAGLLAALRTGIIGPHISIAQTPHGAELFNIKEILPDLTDAWPQMLERIVADAIHAAEKDKRLDISVSGLDAAALARLVIASVEGIKLRATSPEQMEADIEALVGLVGRTVSPRSHPMTVE